MSDGIYKFEKLADRPGYYRIYHWAMGEPVWDLWQDDFMVVWMMYETALARYGGAAGAADGVARANDALFFYLLGMTHAVLHSDKYPRLTRRIEHPGGVEVSFQMPEGEKIKAAVSGQKFHGTTSDRDDPAIHKLTPGGQYDKYLVLSEEERKKGFVRPLRHSYVHKACGAITKMGPEIVETYARDPNFYNATFCVCCERHFPLIDRDGLRAFVWEDGSGVGE